MPDKNLNASPSSVHHTFDSHTIISPRFEPSCPPEAFGHSYPVEAQEIEATLPHESIGRPLVPVNELGIYEAPELTEDCLSPLETFNESVEPLAAPVHEEALHEEDPPGHIRSPILSK
jgi:hypothetical protein